MPFWDRAPVTSGERAARGLIGVESMPTAGVFGAAIEPPGIPTAPFHLHQCRAVRTREIPYLFWKSGVWHTLYYTGSLAFDPGSVYSVVMTCRHARGDRSCSTQFPEYQSQAPQSPDVERFEWIDAQQVGTNFVAKIKYPNCANCAYEGTKVMVYVGVTPMDALRWKRIDPHFRDPKKIIKLQPTAAPSPVARFPASPEGWAAALKLAETYGRG